MQSVFYEEEISFLEREHKRPKRNPKLPQNSDKEFGKLVAQFLPPIQTQNRFNGIDVAAFVEDLKNDVTYVFDRWKIQLVKIEKNKIIPVANFEQCQKKRIFGLAMEEDGHLLATQQKWVVKINPITKHFTEVLSLEQYDFSLGKLAIDHKYNIVYIHTDNNTILKWNRTLNKITDTKNIFTRCIFNIVVDSKNGDLLCTTREKTEKQVGVITITRNRWLDWIVARLIWKTQEQYRVSNCMLTT